MAHLDLYVARFCALVIGLAGALVLNALMQVVTW